MTRFALVTATGVIAGSSYVAAAASAPGDAGRAQVLVQFRPGASATDMAAAIKGVGASDLGTVRDLGVHVLQVPAAAASAVVAALSHRDDVTYAEPDAAVTATQTPTDPDWGSQWGPVRIHAPAAWDATTGSSSVVVAALDTGVDFSQEDLQGRFVAGYDFVNNDSDPTDDNGHGTSVAGVIGASANNGVDIAGMCWQCRIMPVKVLDANGTGTYSTLANGITWATDHGAQVISMSLVGSTDSTTLHSAVQYAHNHGVVLVAAAGNSSSTAATYPASYPEVLGVAGTTSTDTVYSWSNYGSWVKLAAPGCNEATLIGGGYGTFCGTSSATPIVAGVAALLRSAAPAATNAQLESALESSATPIGGAVAYGRVDAAAALTAVSGGGSTSGGSSGGQTTSTSTSTWSGSFSGRTTTRSYSLATASGVLSAKLTFSKATSMSLALYDASNTVVASGSGTSPVGLTDTVSSGSYTLVVSGPAKSSYTLTATYPS